MKIIIDTNFLLIPFKFKVDIFSEFNRICSFNYKLFIFEESINELKDIIKKESLKDKKAAKFALILIELKRINIIKSEQRDVDWLILNKSDKDTVVATLDSNLKRELLRKGVSVIILRQKKYLQLAERKAL